MNRIVSRLDCVIASMVFHQMTAFDVYQSTISTLLLEVIDNFSLSPAQINLAMIENKRIEIEQAGENR